MRSRLAIILSLLLACQAQAAPGFRLPPGFTCTEFAGDDLAHDCYTLTINPKGQVVVAGRGYIRTLIDDHGDGRANRAIEVADHPKDGAMGLLWQGDTLWAVGDGGLRRFKIGPGGKAVGPSELVYKLKTGGEHDAHALRRGPDGWLYWLCGNDTGISAKDSGPTSPIDEPIAGVVLRFPPDFGHCEIVADGFRNAYDFDFSADGELITFDSDNERCVGLPWYEGCRLYHVVPGGHYGWLAPQRAAFWRLPPYFPDVVAPLADLGRGSPTGVACYRHRQFPEKYRGGYFLGDWTFGRIYYADLTPSGSTYKAKVERFLESTGDNGFAPTGLAVHPKTGDLYVSIGGRGTRGAVYRIRYDAGLKQAAGYQVPPLPRRSLDWNDRLGADLPKQATAGDELSRRRALELLWRHREHFDEWARQAVIQECAAVGDRPFSLALGRLVALQHAPFTGLSKIPLTDTPGFTLGLFGGSYAEIPGAALNWGTLLAGYWYEQGAMNDCARFVQLALGGIGDPKVRGTVWEGYTPRRPVSNADRRYVLEQLRPRIQTTGRHREFEIARVLAMLADDDPKSLARVAAKLTFDSDPLDEIHYLICIARLTAPRTPEITSQVKLALLGLDQKMTARGISRDTNWPLRIAELHAELARRDPKLNEQIIAYIDFPRPGNAVFTRCPGFERRRAAERFLERAKQSKDFAWNAELVALMGELPAETVRPLLVKLWDRGGVEDAIIPLLARQPRPADREKFLTGLRSPQLVSVCLEALDKLPATADSAELLALIRTLRTLGESKADASVREKIVGRLRKLTGQSIGQDKVAWSEWLTRTHPELAAKLGGADGVDVAAWRKRLAPINWAAGDASRGKATFTKASCASCHSGGSAVGPDLRGAGSRFARVDLLTAILQPSKDIAARYRTVQLATTDGKVYQGLIVYEATDGLILQTGPAATVRIAGNEIASRGFSDISMMPVGLLDKLADAEIADLLAYLKALK